MCREAASDLSSLFASSAANAQQQNGKNLVDLIALGTGTCAMAREFQSQYRFAGRIFSDPDRAVYKHFNCAYGASATFNRNAWNAAKRAYAKGFRQGSFQGDWKQQGALIFFQKKTIPDASDSFLVSVPWIHVEKFAGDHLPADEILRILHLIQQQVPNDD